MGESFPLVRAIDQSGLSAAYVSGATDFDTYVAATTHDSQPGSDRVATATTGSAVFALGAALLRLPSFNLPCPHAFCI